jgi:hypothetical protein
VIDSLRSRLHFQNIGSLIKGHESLQSWDEFQLDVFIFGILEIWNLVFKNLFWLTNRKCLIFNFLNKIWRLIFDWFDFNNQFWAPFFLEAIGGLNINLVAIFRIFYHNSYLAKFVYLCDTICRYFSISSLIDHFIDSVSVSWAIFWFRENKTGIDRNSSRGSFNYNCFVTCKNRSDVVTINKYYVDIFCF